MMPFYFIISHAKNGLFMRFIGISKKNQYRTIIKE